MEYFEAVFEDEENEESEVTQKQKNIKKWYKIVTIYQRK